MSSSISSAPSSIFPRVTSSSCVSARVNASSPRAQLGEQPGGAVSREAQRRIDPRDENHACVEWEMRESTVDRRDADLAGHRVEIVEHQEQPLPERSDAVHELVDRILDRTARYTEPL